MSEKETDAFFTKKIPRQSMFIEDDTFFIFIEKHKGKTSIEELDR